MPRILVLLVLLASLLLPARSSQAAAPQLRGFWVDAFHEGIKTPEQTRRLIADAQRAGANALFVQVRRRADSYYRDSVEPIASDVQGGYDPLADVIAQAHARNMQVHAWTVALPAWKDGYSQPNRSHVWYQHGPDKSGWDNWFTRDVDGRAGECAAPNDCGYFLDPGHPAVADYTVSALMHLAQRYDIDGLHLDYIRYASPRYGYNPVSLARFQAATGRSDKPAPEDAQWMQWRRDQVTKLVKRIYLNLNAVKPRATLSVAAIAWGAGPPNGNWSESSPFKRTLQDWNGWLNAGYVDFVVPMVYDKEDGGQQQGWYDGWVNFIRNNHGRRAAAVGVGVWLNNADQNLAQIRRGASAGIGTVLYSYAIPVSGDRNNFLDRLRNEAWGDGAPAPVFSWKAQPSTGHLLGHVLVNGAAGENLAVRISGNGQPESHTNTDANGIFGVVDLPPGNYSLTMRDPLSGADVGANFSIGPGGVATLRMTFPQSDPATEWSPAGADADGAFGGLWNRTDLPVAQGRVSRSWTWGPKTYATGWERYAEAPNGKRLVQYWDKSRMEITNPGGDRNQLWFVTNGLLTKELISGNAQVGNSAFVQRAPATVPVAGDPDDSNSPTYASFAQRASLNGDRREPAAVGATVVQTINRGGSIGTDQNLGRYGVRIAAYNNELGHNIPNVFTDYFRTLPVDWVFALGYPIAEPYWARVKVGGQVKDVLIQVYERRVLTYTPANAAQYRVEMGNVGQHYWRWRYSSAPWE
ncbi:MAG TPA: family 10 glycosylhydrolase [Herpetosiphonaceae bacterium]